MLMSIHSPLPALAKRIFISKGSCLRWASDFFLSLPLPALGKLFIFYDNPQKHPLLPSLGSGQISTRTYGDKSTYFFP